MCALLLDHVVLNTFLSLTITSPVTKDGTQDCERHEALRHVFVLGVCYKHQTKSDSKEKPQHKSAEVCITLDITARDGLNSHGADPSLRNDHVTNTRHTHFTGITRTT